MTIQTFYEVIGEDYEDVFNRFMMESLVVKFVKKFIEDPTFDMLEQSLENHDVQEAIRASHTFKGICDNMGFVKLKKALHCDAFFVALSRASGCPEQRTSSLQIRPIARKGSADIIFADSRLLFG